LRFSIGITIHNEERNIGRLLAALAAEALAGLGLDQVVVVSSGSTDRSDAIVSAAARTDPLVRLIVEPERRGKASAINQFLSAANAAEVLVLMSGDILPAPGTIEKLLQAFADPRVGMCGGRPVPTGEPTRLIHRIVRLQWELHHQVSLHTPKLGEVVAFRNVVDRIPTDTAVDEAAIEAAIEAQGYTLRYVPDAIVWNKGPETIADFLRQRRRIAAGHHHLTRTQRYQVATGKNGFVARVALGHFLAHPGELPVAAATAALEGYGRLLGLWDLKVKGKNPYVWEMAASTKDLTPGAAPVAAADRVRRKEA
jgi:cellulose synthase/poly-beta-1,6-N-acetylglucosamine synthase-like glycosyltransferase